MRKLFRGWHRGALVGAGAALLVLPVAAAAAPPPVRLHDSTPRWATPSQRAGDVRGGQRISVNVYLAWRGDAEAYARALSDPSSPSYGAYLSPAQFRARFAATDAQVRGVVRWLRGHGLSIGEIPANHHFVEAVGTVAQLEAAFGTTLSTYHVDGKTLRAPSRAPAVPADLAGTVTSVAGLDGGDDLVHPNAIVGDSATPDAPPAPASVNAGPCSSYWSEKVATDLPPANGAPAPWIPCGWTPSQLQSAYGVDGPISHGLDGRGQSVAIVDAFASPTIARDASTYSARHGLPPIELREVVPPGLYNAPETPTSDPQGWYGEETLDVEAVHAMAPRAQVVYVAGADDSDRALDAAVNRVVDRHLAQIVTNSYGNLGELLPPDVAASYQETFVAAAIEGIGVYFSSGDSGDDVAATGTRQTDFPASSPWVTAVGGTSLAIGRQGQYLFETGWGTARSTLANGAWTPPPPGDFLYGAGGGTSRLFAEPWYQQGVVPDTVANAYGTPGRAVPDVAADGDPDTGFLEGQTQTFPDGSVRYGEYRIGGTSLSSPLLAGVMALADQAAGAPHGFANPRFYRLGGSGATHDVTPPAAPIAVARDDYANGVDASEGTTTSLRSFDLDSSLPTATGWDQATGIGSPAGLSFLSALARPGQ
jgi:subtilase family serine protease